MLRLFTSEGREKIHAKGEDQLLSLKAVYAATYTGAISGENGYISVTVPAGVYVKVTSIVARNQTTAASRLYLRILHDGVAYYGTFDNAGIGANVWWSWQGEVWADADDLIGVVFSGGQVGDTCDIYVLGLQMTKES